MPSTQQYTQNALFHFHSNNGYTKASPSYAIRILHILVNNFFGLKSDKEYGKKLHPAQQHTVKEWSGEYRHNPTLSLTSTVGGGGWFNVTSRQLYSLDWRCTHFMRLGGPQGRSGLVRKLSPPPRFDLRAVQANESLYRLSYRGPQQREIFRHVSNFLHLTL